MYLYLPYEETLEIGTIILKNNLKQHASPGDSPRPPRGRVGRGEQCDARQANSTPNGGPHLELARLRLKAWCKNLGCSRNTSPIMYTFVYMMHYYRICWHKLSSSSFYYAAFSRLRTYVPFRCTMYLVGRSSWFHPIKRILVCLVCTNSRSTHSSTVLYVVIASSLLAGPLFVGRPYALRA